MDRDRLCVVCPSKQHVFTSVFIGDGNPPRQVCVYLLLHKSKPWWRVHKVLMYCMICHFCLSFQQVYGLYNGCAMPFLYQVDLSVLSQLQKDNFNHPLLHCLNPEGKVLPGQTVVLEWIFSPMEAKMYQVSKVSDSPNTLHSFILSFFLFCFFFLNLRQSV